MPSPRSLPGVVSMSGPRSLLEGIFIPEGMGIPEDGGVQGVVIPKEVGIPPSRHGTWILLASRWYASFLLYISFSSMETSMEKSMF